MANLPIQKQKSQRVMTGFANHSEKGWGYWDIQKTGYNLTLYLIWKQISNIQI